MRIIGLTFLLLFIAAQAYGADSLVRNMTEDSAPSLTDIIYEVKDPGGTPLDRKLQLGSLGTLFDDFVLSDFTASKMITIDASKKLVELTLDTDDFALSSDTLSLVAEIPHLDVAETIAGDWDNTANPWSVPEGGTGAATFTSGGLLTGSGTGAITALGVATNGQIPIGDGTTDPTLATITGTADEITVTNAAGSITLSLGADGTNRMAEGDTMLSLGDGDTTPDMSNGGTGIGSHFWQTNNTGAQAITDFEDGDGDHSEFSAGDWFLLRVDDQYLSYDFDNTDGGDDDLERSPDIDWTSASGYIGLHLWVYDGVRWICPTLNGGMTGPNTLAIGSLGLPFDESTDAALTVDGQVHIRGDEDRISYDAGTGGEVAGEVTKSLLEVYILPIDFTYVYDRDVNNRIHLFEVNSKLWPNGIILDYIRVTYTKDPTTELDADLMRADDIIGVANAAKIDDLITVAGSFIEDTDANINAGAAVAAGQDIYIEVQADPVDEDVLANVMIIFHGEED